MPRRQSPRLDEAIDQYLAYCASQGQTRETLANARSALGSFRTYAGNCRVATIHPADVRAWLHQRLDAGLGLGTAGRYRSTVRGMGRFAHREHWTVYTDWATETTFRESYRGEFRRLSVEELDRIFNLPGLHPRDSALLALASNTGLRIGEITRLRVQDLDLEYRDAAGAWKPRLRATRLKKKRAVIDYIPVTADLADSMREWLAAYGAAGHVGTNYLVPTLTTPKYHDGQERSQRIRPDHRITHASVIARRIFTAAGLEVPRGEAWHVFRRSVARIFFDMQCATSGYAHALRQTATLLGHEHTATTERYLGLDLDQEARDEALAGKAFLSRLMEHNVGHAGVVIDLRGRRRK